MVPEITPQSWLMRHFYTDLGVYQLAVVSVSQTMSQPGVCSIIRWKLQPAGYPPSSRQMLTMFIDGLPTNIVLFITLYDNVMIFLNEPDDSLLLNIHQLFDHFTRIDGNVIRSRLLNHDHHSHQSSNHPTVTPSSTTAISAPTSGGDTATIHKCGNCGLVGHPGPYRQDLFPTGWQDGGT